MTDSVKGERCPGFTGRHLAEESFPLPTLTGVAASLVEETPTEAGESPQPEKEETGADRGFVDSTTGVRITLEDLMRAWA